VPIEIKSRCGTVWTQWVIDDQQSEILTSGRRRRFVSIFRNELVRVGEDGIAVSRTVK